MRNALLTVLGFVMVLTPLGLWVAWSEKIFYGLLLCFGIAFCLICLIDDSFGTDREPRS